MCALGQPAHIPVSFTSAELPTTSISSMSPPSARMKGRTRSSTASIRSLVIMAVEWATHVPATRRRKPADSAGSRQRAPQEWGLFRGGGERSPPRASRRVAGGARGFGDQVGDRLHFERLVDPAVGAEFEAVANDVAAAE